MTLDTIVSMHVLAGMMVAAYAVVALFFLRFWRDTHDRLFLIFALAFAILGVQRLALIAYSTSAGDATWLYVVRLAAFVLILWAIVDKNRAASRR